MSPSEVFLPNERTITVGNLEDTLKKEFSIKFTRDNNNDRLLKLKLTAVDSTGKTLNLIDSQLVYNIYIKPLLLDSPEDASKKGYEFWLFTGTNLDFIDGPKLKELYFKASYLVNLKQDNKFTKHWFYLTSGKNRYFSEKDSLSRVLFTDIILKPTPGDSITIANGYYNSFRQTTTDNYFASLKYLYQINSLSSENAKLFFNTGFYFALQTIKTNYTNHDIISDTNSYFRVKDSTYTFRPLLNESKIKQFNSNISVGLIHILTTKSINVKSHLDVGVNLSNYPYSIVRNTTNEFTTYKSDKRLYIAIGFEGTALSSGISLGFESFLRAADVPLINVSLTKVIQLEQIGNLFGKLSTATN